MIDFIDEKYIYSLLEQAKESSAETINKILDRYEQSKGLTPYETAVLLTADKESPELKRIFKIAGEVKKNIYGSRVVMFAPLYISDYCVNRCQYCNFNCSHDYKRKKLTQDEIREEVRVLESSGHKRLALEAGEDPLNCPIEYILESIGTIYDMKFEKGEIRRVNVNIAATTIENYKKLKNVGIGTYILFQETYHKLTYEKAHISGPKSEYSYHLYAFDRAMQAGIDDVGAGVLFGLYDYRYEALALLLHNKHLENIYNVGFHTVSFPRICHAKGAEQKDFPNAVSDANFKKLIAVMRLAIPFTGMIISTRESPDMRAELLNLGISQVSGGSRVDVGGYSGISHTAEQFEPTDERTARDVAKWLLKEKFIPSFCTACYRNGRTGDRFMSLAKSGNIKNVCHPNALVTLFEYAQDYGDEEFKNLTDEVIKRELDSPNSFENEKIRSFVAESIEKIRKGDRDFYI